MEPSKLSYIADIVSLIAGSMTILGIGGVVTWSFARNRPSQFNEKVITIFSYSTKIFLCVVAAWPILMPASIAKFMLLMFIRDIFEVEIKLDPFWDSGHPLPYLAVYIFISLLAIPIYAICCQSIMRWSLKPFTEFYRRISNRKAVK